MTAPNEPPGALSPSPASPPAEESEVVRTLRERFADAVLDVSQNRGQFRVTIARERLPEVVQFLRDEPALRFDFLVDLSALDHYGAEPRFRTFYVLRSMSRHEELVLKCEVPEEDCWVPTLTGLFATADWLERECYDMFGIDFRGHPDLRRILMPEFFTDFALRKDFPLPGRLTDQEWAEWIIARAQRLEAGD